MSTVVGKSCHPFLNLQDSVRKQVAKDIIEANEDLSSCLKPALAHMAKDHRAKQLTDPEDQNIKCLVSMLDEAVQNLPVVAHWKQKGIEIEELTPFIAMFKNRCIYFGLSTAATAIYYRSNKVFVIANTISAIACVVLVRFSGLISQSLDKITDVLNGLTVANLQNLEENINNVYKELEKTSYFMRFYLNARNPKNHVVDLLAEQQVALSCLRKIFKGISQSKNLSGPEPTPENVKLFFNKFEKICRKGMQGTLSIGLFAMSWTYYAYMQRAYLMILAGTVTSLGSAYISRELYRLQIGSRKVYSAQEAELNNACEDIVKSSTLLRRMDVNKEVTSTIQIGRVIVMPLEAILTLIPSWKTRAN